jgi:hypothetical protein
MRYTKFQVQSWVAKLEALDGPRHRHQSVIRVGPTDDVDELLAAARAECKLYGCTYGHIITREAIGPGDWAITITLEEVARLGVSRMCEVCHYPVANGTDFCIICESNRERQSRGAELIPRRDEEATS